MTQSWDGDLRADSDWVDYGYDDFDDDPDPDFCDHEDYEPDIINGRAMCHQCGHTWWMTEAEIDAEIARIRAYDEWQREQERPWNRFKGWARDKVEPSLSTSHGHHS
jgi:hypothetical protein